MTYYTAEVSPKKADRPTRHQYFEAPTVDALLRDITDSHVLDGTLHATINVTPHFR